MSGSQPWLVDLYGRARAYARHLRLHEWLPIAAVPMLRAFFGALPALPHGADGWDVLDARSARPRQWRLVLPVRCRCPDDGYLDDVDPVHGAALDVGFARAQSAVFGGHVVDLLAVDFSMLRPPRRLVGVAAALGFGCAGEYTDHDDQPVPIARDLRDWLHRLPDGLTLPLGPIAEQAETLRQFRSGIVGADLDHGLLLERLVRRSAPAPIKIMVAA